LCIEVNIMLWLKVVDILARLTVGVYFWNTYWQDCHFLWQNDMKMMARSVDLQNVGPKYGWGLVYRIGKRKWEYRMQ
jgi:hypothetical protein